MKLLVLLAVLLIAYLVWRNARVQRRDAGTRPPGAPAAGPVEMVSCPECGVHLPRTDALPGPDGRFYCCNEHRLRGGG
jgi:uncharacterized protein